VDLQPRREAWKSFVCGWIAVEKFRRSGWKLFSETARMAVRRLRFFRREMQLARFHMLSPALALAAASFFPAPASAQSSTPNKVASNAPPSSAEVQRGKKIFNLRCAVCHFPQSAAKKIGPGMKGLSKRGHFADGKPVDDASLRQWIETGGKNMPGFKDSLDGAQIRDLIAYLKTL
jgi:mono/diheme cytochrome c family protein